MVTLQILNKVLDTKNISLLTTQGVDETYFLGYEDQYKFILDHYRQYGVVPDPQTFLDKFREHEYFTVDEQDSYLLDKLFEEKLYCDGAKVLNTCAEVMKSDANEAVEYLISALPDLQPKRFNVGIDIIGNASDRLDFYKSKGDPNNNWFYSTGFPELDEIIHGWEKGEDFIILFARTGQGKSWILVKTVAHVWQLGGRVGYISPEMSPTKIGYRFDTVFRNFSNRNLIWGNSEPEYENYIEELKNFKNPFIVATPKDFNKKITVTRLREFVTSNKLDLLAIDGITYLSDEKYKKGDSKTISLTNISQDLMDLSLELKIPIIVVIQSNRGGVKTEEGGTPELEDIRDSDGPAQNATKVIAIRQTGAGLEFGIKKNRDNPTGGKLLYYWDIDKGEFQYIPSEEDAVKPQERKEKTETVKRSYKDSTEVF